MRILICTYMLFLLTSITYSQDNKKVVHKINNSLIEEFFVLKSDKTIRNGNYVKYALRLAIQEYLLEYGNYAHNRKSGSWYYFNAFHPQNPLSFVGEYADDQRTGQWAYFYSSEINDTSTLYLLGYNKSSSFSSSKKDIQISIDTTGLKLCAIGNFEKNIKVGQWKYYSKEGKLIKIYDFSSKKEIYSLNNDSLNLYLLGGFSHFQQQLNYSLLENVQELKGLPGSSASFEIITHDGNLFVNNLTPLVENPLAMYIEKAIKSMPLFWIDYDPVFEKFTFIVSLKFTKEEHGSNIQFESIRPTFDSHLPGKQASAP